MDPEIMERFMLDAAIAASLQESQTPEPLPPPQPSESLNSVKKSSPLSDQSLQPKPISSNVVDLTKDSSDDSDVEEVFPKSKSVIGSDTDNEPDGSGSDEDLKRAIEMSLEGVHRGEKGPKAQKPLASSKASDSVASVPSQGLSGLDRKKMEEERLARLAKRKADSNSPRQSPAKVLKTAGHKPDPSSQGTLSQVAPQIGVCNQPAANAQNVKVQPTVQPGVQYPLGAIKKTRLANKARVGNDITFEEVIQQEDLKLAVLSSFMWDVEWLYPKFDPTRTRLLLVIGAKEQSERDNRTKEVEGIPNIRLCFPPMAAQVNCMHSKLMLLFHSEYLRIVVPTANLTRFDWGEQGLMENTVFLIDLPKKSPGTSESRPAFKDELVYFLKASNLNVNIIAKLDSFDFNMTSRYAFVYSVGGTNDGDSWKRNGYPGLGRAVARMGLESSEPLEIDYVTSSVGSLNDDFLRAMYLAAKGDDGSMEYTLRTTKTSSTQTNDERRKMMLRNGEEWHDRFRVYFPSDQTVRAAHARPADTAGTICFQPQWWHGSKFPRRVLKDCESERGVLMHNKLMFVRPSHSIPLRGTNIECQGWAYVGSANLSESAWGRLVKGRGPGGQMKLNCRNWECGVVVPVTKLCDSSLSTTSSETLEEITERATLHDTFRDTIPVPMKLPTSDLTESRAPWFYSTPAFS
ncbi:hypothetical protein N7462_010371 [Penicillium macrosclerotiorum]|uniref:uncharacterized protein n=1 Tax=Penicillium macrosclerotiorum TaxID=303699 RepID=UPI002546DB5F|nr:uncharacterized protein N7462_010371 [Penicillium macrosclerotiorum]KAJ5669301.1 hypothetical protein N7462_010371 [Penicillium macrosclerotiorum]